MNINSIKNSVFSFFQHKLPQFFSNSFKVTSSKTSKIIGAVIFAVTLIGVIICVNSFVSAETSFRWLLLAIALALPFISGVSAAFTVRLKSEKIDKIWHFIFIFILPLISVTITECLNGIFIYDMTYLGFFGNYLVFLVFYFVFFALTGSFRVSYIVVTTLFFGLGVAHAYLMEFRGTPFLPMDFLSITTAMGVANTYNYMPNYKIVLAALMFIFVIIVSIKTKTPKYNLATKIVSRTFTATFSIILLLLFFGTNVFADMGIKPDFWNQTRGYRNYGFAFNFFCNTKYLYMSEPTDYNPDKIKDYVEGVIDKNETIIDDSYEKPNIICIMNE
ncbi:MAG: hypothetical protein IJP34_01585 [Clostridia bacterium]|nr:hypothetical protein [Clostridia bacterium]